MVTRLGPSPTGSVHIGGLYVGLINKDLAGHTGGRYLLRVEDTDQAREIEGAAEQFTRVFAYFGLEPDESSVVGGDYGPYLQSQREHIYLSFVRELLHQARPTSASPPRRSWPTSGPGRKRPKLPPVTTAVGRSGATPPTRTYRRPWTRGVRTSSGSRPRKTATGDHVRGRDPRQAAARGEPERRGDPEELDQHAAASHLPLRARRGRSPDAGHPRDPG